MYPLVSLLFLTVEKLSLRNIQVMSFLELVMSFVKGIITCVNQSYEGISPPAEEVICVICIFMLFQWLYFRVENMEITFYIYVLCKMEL